MNSSHMEGCTATCCVPGFHRSLRVAYEQGRTAHECSARVRSVCADSIGGEIVWVWDMDEDRMFITKVLYGNSATMVIELVEILSIVLSALELPSFEVERQEKVAPGSAT